MAIASNNPWLPRINSNPQAKLRLFCFPYAGGSSYTFESWVDVLPNTVEICPIELPGRRRRFRDPLYKRLDSLITDLSVAIVPYLDKPFIFFGHSMGGLVSFELTRLLRRKNNLSPVHLLISARSAIQLPPSKPPIHHLEYEAFKQEVIRLGGTPQAILENQEMMDLMIPIVKADFEVIETHTYQPEIPLNIPLTIFGGENDLEVTPEELAAWEEQTSANFSLKMFEGGHFFIEEQRSLLLKSVNSILKLYV
ncbi:MAG: alpha/beta fold hydrolase [Cyanobacteria bacterium P01_F01_bin.143]